MFALFLIRILQKSESCEDSLREKIRKILHFRSEFLSVVMHFVAAVAAVKPQIFGKFDGKIGEFANSASD